MENRVRTHRVQVRLDDEEYAYFCYLVEQTGLKQEVYLRKLIEGKTPQLREETEMDRDILSQLYAIGNNLNQIARLANSTKLLDVERYDQAVDDFRAVMARFLKSEESR